MQTEDDIILGILCIKQSGDRTKTYIEKLKRLYRQTGLGFKHLLTRSLGLLEDIEYELNDIKSKKWEIQLLEDRVKIMQCVGGIVLYFHYESLLRPQIQIIAKIISALTNGGHALLESPTGTGKTAAVVAAICSWLKYISSQPGHRVQIRQVLDEIRKSCFSLEVACLGSRAVTCPLIKRGSDINSADSFCQSARSGKQGDPRGCRYFRGLESKAYASRVHFRCRSSVQRILNPDRKKEVMDKYDMKDGLWDIEELVDFCTGNNSKTNQFILESNRASINSYFATKSPPTGCPYYTSKSLSVLADIIICPYSYVIDFILAVVSEDLVQVVKTSSKTELQKMLLDRAIGFLPDFFFSAGARFSLGNNVIVMDEAHNIEPFCREIGSFDISLIQIQRATSWLKEVSSSTNSKKLLDLAHENANHLYQYLSNLANGIKKASNRCNSFISWDRYDSKENKLGGTSLFLKEFGITLIDSFIALSSTFYITHFDSSEDDTYYPYKRLLVNLLSILVLVCKNTESYSVRLELESGTPHLRFFLQRAGVILDPLSSKAKSLILISGTLAPLKVTSTSLGESFVKRLHCTLEAGHVISKDQFTLFTLSSMPIRGGGSISLECVHRNLQNDSFLSSLGNSLASLSSILPGNILIFFPNRELIRRCIELWKRIKYKNESNTIYDYISKSKGGLYTEPKTSLEFSDMVIKMGLKSFILMASFRGHASEGLNLSVQSLVLVGLPFANRVDPAVDACIRFGSVTGLGDWYVIDAYRAINQSIGRCIRKKTDTGIVLLMDSRHSIHSSNLSAWLKPHIINVNDFYHLELLIKNTMAYKTTKNQLN